VKTQSSFITLSGLRSLLPVINAFLIRRLITINSDLVKNHIIIQAHSNPVLYYEAIFAIYSLGIYDNLSDYHFVIYTDNSKFFQPYLDGLNVSYHDIPAALLKEWMGPSSFIHRAKIKMLQDASQYYQGNFLYVDSDVCFQKGIRALFTGIANGDLYLHRCESQLQEVKMYLPLVNMTVTIEGTFHLVAASLFVWNAGVIGFDSFNGRKLEQVLTLTDHIYETYQKHIVEQFAFSFIFQLNQTIQSAEQEILHYWFLKEEFRKYLEKIFSDPLMDRDTLHKIACKVNLQQDAERKIQWRSRSGLYRAYKRITGKAFQLSPLPEIKDLITSRQ
jgi:hypothetical protein